MLGIDGKKKPGKRGWRVAVASSLALGLIVLSLVATHTSGVRAVPYSEVWGPPTGVGPVATGTLDGVAWQQFVWSKDGRLCIFFEAGATTSDCVYPDIGFEPFTHLPRGDSPVIAGNRAAATTVVMGTLSTSVTSVRVVEPAGSGAVATITRCPCPAANLRAEIFMLPLTREQTASDANGRYVVMAAFDGRVELGRVRIPIINLGYCGSRPCAQS